MGRNKAEMAIDTSDVVGEVGDDLAELAEVAVSAAAVTGRLGFRVLRRTVRFIARHPREALVGAVVVTVAVAAIKMVRSRSASQPSS
jgi:hypothetical protein